MVLMRMFSLGMVDIGFSLMGFVEQGRMYTYAMFNENVGNCMFVSRRLGVFGTLIFCNA